MKGKTNSLAIMLALAFSSSPAWAVSQKTAACETMASAAYEIMKARAAQTKHLATEQKAMEFIRKFGLPRMNVDFLDGLITLIYRDEVKAQPGEVALNIYTACVMR